MADLLYWVLVGTNDKRGPYPKAVAETKRDALIADIVDTTTQLRHPQCCKAVGCPDGSCNLLPDDLHGAALLEHIESGAHTAAVEKSRAVREAALQTQIAAEA